MDWGCPQNDRTLATGAGGAEASVADHRGIRPLHYAARSGHTEAVERLLAANADVRHCLCFVFRLPLVAETLPVPCAPAASRG